MGGIFGNERALDLIQKIKQIIIASCASVQSVIINDKHCFELYGFDIIIDEQLKPWLIEINSSPSLSATTSSDRAFKRKLIFDLFQVIIPTNCQSDKRRIWCNKKKVGDFHLIFNEEQNDERYADSNYDAANKYDRSQKKKFKTGWR